MRELSIRQRRTHWDTTPKGQSLSQSQGRIFDTIPPRSNPEVEVRATRALGIGIRRDDDHSRNEKRGTTRPVLCLIAICASSTCNTQLPAPPTSAQSAISQNTSKHTVLHQARHYKIASTSGRLSEPKSAYKQIYRFQP